MSDQGSDAQLDPLLRARPELRLALAYLGDQAGTAQLALAAILRQWVEAVYGIDDLSVASSKLRWWVEELAAAREGHTHHPLAAALFADPAAQAIEPAAWQRAIDAGLALREAPPASDLCGQLAACQAFHGALAAIETTLCFGVGADPSRAARLTSLGHLTSSLLHLGDARVDNDGLPMRLLARHGLERTALADASTARRAAIDDQLRDLQSAWGDAMSMTGPLGLATRVTAAADARQLRKARRSREPLAVLASARSRIGPGVTLLAWRAGRERRREATRQGNQAP